MDLLVALFIKEKTVEPNDASSGGVGGSMSRQEFADVRADDGRTATRRFAHPDGPSDELAGRGLAAEGYSFEEKAIDRRQPETDGGHEVLADLRSVHAGIDQDQRQEVRAHQAIFLELGSITDDQAMIWVRNWLDIDTAVTQLHSKYVPIVRGALPGKKAATFFQRKPRAHLLCGAFCLPVDGGAHINCAKL